MSNQNISKKPKQIETSTERNEILPVYPSVSIASSMTALTGAKRRCALDNNNIRTKNEAKIDSVNKTLDKEDQYK